MSDVKPPNEAIEVPFSEDGMKRMLEQAFELWVNPEIERRRTAGEIGEDFVLTAAQRLQWPDGRISVRLNDEIKGIASTRVTRDVEEGEAVYLSDLQGLEAFDLLDEELDCGHWTMLWTGKSWFVGFNFLSQRGRCLDLIYKAEQFLQAATDACSRQHAAVAVDTLFSACELVAKAELVSSHQVDLSAKTHGSISSQLNRWRKMGNVEGAFVDLFNVLGGLRGRYRYDAQVSDPTPVSVEDLQLVEAMISASRRRIGKKAV